MMPSQQILCLENTFFIANKNTIPQDAYLERKKENNSYQYISHK